MAVEHEDFPFLFLSVEGLQYLFWMPSSTIIEYCSCIWDLRHGFFKHLLTILQDAASLSFTTSSPSPTRNLILVSFLKVTLNIQMLNQETSQGSYFQCSFFVINMFHPNDPQTHKHIHPFSPSPVAGIAGFFKACTTNLIMKLSELSLNPRILKITG